MNVRYSEVDLKDIVAIKSSGLFDEKWYVETYPDVFLSGVDPVRHYLWIGAHLGRSPSQDFDTKAYIHEYDDVAKAELNPLLHYIRWGRKEGRLAFPIAKSVLGSTTEIKTLDPHKQKIADIKDRIPRKSGVPTVVYESHNLKMQGAPNSLFEIASGIHGRNRFQAVLSCSSPGPLSSLYDDQGIETVIHAISQNRMKDSKGRENWLSNLSDYYRAIDAAVVHVNTLQNFHAVIAAKRAGCAVVWNIRESEEPSSYYDYLPEDARALAYSAFEHADAVVFVANSTRRRWEKFWTRPVNALTVYNGISMDRMMRPLYGTNRATIRASFNLRDSDIVLLSVGTVCDRKGQKDLVGALKLIHRDLLPRVVVAIVGFNSSEYSNDVRRELELLESEGLRAIAIEETQGEDERRALSELYLCADAFVFCSRMESYPRVIMEALEFGLPIVSTPCFGVQEQLEDGVSGLFYPEEQVDVLAAKLSLLIEDRQLRKQMSRAASRRLHVLNSYEQMIQAYENIYESLSS